MTGRHDLNGRMFSTKDNDNDLWCDNCATYFIGAWWFNGCSWSCLNGPFHGSGHRAIGWYEWKDAWVPLSFSEMKIRRN